MILITLAVACQAQAYPDKHFYSLGSARTCLNMKKTKLEDLYDALEKEQYAIELDSEIMEKAKVALERMVSYV